jgi:enamine deaminase RidA (YjgF/YER057c/UK114 family)
MRIKKLSLTAACCTNRLTPPVHEPYKKFWSLKTMGAREQKLQELGYDIKKIKPEGDLIKGVVTDGTTLYASGQVPMDGDVLVSKGKVPSEVSVEDAKKAAELCAANLLRAVHRHVGDLDRIERVIRITGYVNTDTDFTDCHVVINGASHLVREVFGDAGQHARTAIGLAQLPLGCSVEVEMILRLKSE